MFNFKKLDAWQHAVALADAVYLLTRAFPAEQFGRLYALSERQGRILSGLRNFLIDR